MKKTVIITLAASLALLLGGCADSNTSSQQSAVQSAEGSTESQSGAINGGENSESSESSESKAFVSEYPPLNEENVPFDPDATFMTDCKRYYVTVTEAEALGYTFSVCGQMINNNADYYSGYCTLYAFKDGKMVESGDKSRGAALPSDGGQGGMKYVKTDIASVLKAYVMTDRDKEYPFAVVTVQSISDNIPNLSCFYSVADETIREFRTIDENIIPFWVENLSDDYSIEGNTLTDTKSNIKYIFDFENMTVSTVP